jgi:hypothetical protein
MSVSRHQSRRSGFVQVTLCLLTSGQRKLKWREQGNALIESRRSAIAGINSPETRFSPVVGRPLTRSRRTGTQISRTAGVEVARRYDFYVASMCGLAIVFTIWRTL